MEKIETKHRRTCDIQSNHSDALITFSHVNKVYVLNFLSFHEHLHVSQDHVSPSPMLVQFFFTIKRVEPSLLRKLMHSQCCMRSV